MTLLSLLHRSSLIPFPTPLRPLIFITPYPVQFARTARMAFYGGALFGPIMTKWFQTLNRLQFKSPARAVIYRVCLDQSMLAPSAFFFSELN